MKKKHGWIRQANNTRSFVMLDGNESKTLKKAHIFPTRKEARASNSPSRLFGIDIVRKVELTKTGKAKKII